MIMTINAGGTIKHARMEEASGKIIQKFLNLKIDDWTTIGEALACDSDINIEFTNELEIENF